MDNLLIGMAQVFTVSNIIFCIIGLSVGIFFGSLPGFSATMAVAVMLPFSYVMEPGAALLLMSGVFCGGVYGGAIPAVLMGIPGTPASAPTATDGMALTQKGESGRALTMATLASSVGGFASAIALIILTPFLVTIALKFGPPESVMLAIFGLTIVSTIAPGNLSKGVLVGLLGLMLGTIGQDPLLGFPRFAFSKAQLIGGLSNVPILIGIYSYPEVIKLFANPDEKLGSLQKLSKFGIRLEDIKDNTVNLIRSSLIGVGIGIVPAAGPDIAAWVSYNEAKKASKHPEKFGQGSIEAIIACEAANNGATGGSLIPLLSLGIPGSTPAALFLGALIIHGLVPGPYLFIENPVPMYTLLVGFAVINILMFFIGLIFCKFGEKILLIPNSILSVSIIILTTVGTFAVNQSIFDLFTMFFAGVIGCIMDKYNYPRSPVAISLLLGKMLEQNLSRTGIIYDGRLMMIFTRPVTLIFTILIILSFAYPLLKKIMKKAKKNTSV